MAFINTNEDLKVYILLASTFEFQKVVPFAKRSDRKYIIPLIGLEQYQELINYQGLDERVMEVVNLFKEASANYAMQLALPVLNVSVTNNGLKKTDTTNSNNADWRDMRDLKRSYMDAANECMDLAIELMELNEGSFPIWKESEYYTLFKSMIVRHTKIFNKHFNIQNSRKTFLALKPYMLEVEDQFLKNVLGQCTRDNLLETSEESLSKQALNYAEKAVVALTIYKASIAGTFSITETSFVLETEELSWERKKMELDEVKLDRLRKDRESAGMNYLQSLKKLLVENPEVFTCHQEVESKSVNERIIRKKSGLYL